MSDPVSRTILLFDIERYSDRDDIEQAYLRRMLYDIADRTLEAAGVEETQRLRADRGDSVMELIDANAPVSTLLRTLLGEVPVLLRAINRMASSSAQIRLRAVLATGYVAIDTQGGWVGSDLNQACRLLDANLLRDALRAREDDFALCVSDAVHHGIVRHGHPGVPPEEFNSVTLGSKNGPLTAWLHGPLPTSPIGEPDYEPAQNAVPPAAAPAVSPSPAPDPTPGTGPTFTFNGGSATFGGSFVNGDQHGVSGGQVTGDVHLGGVRGPGTDRGEH